MMSKKKKNSSHSKLLRVLPLDAPAGGDNAMVVVSKKKKKTNLSLLPVDAPRDKNAPVVVSKETKLLADARTGSS